MRDTVFCLGGENGLQRLGHGVADELQILKRKVVRISGAVARAIVDPGPGERGRCNDRSHPQSAARLVREPERRNKRVWTLFGPPTSQSAISTLRTRFSARNIIEHVHRILELPEPTLAPSFFPCPFSLFMFIVHSKLRIWLGC